MSVALEDAVASIEQRLGALGAALRERDAPAIEQQALELQRALAGAVQRFTHAARLPDGVSPALRQRLALAGGQVAAQRESLARATAALDRAIDVLMPGAAGRPAAYGARGVLDRPAPADGVNV
jgi:ATP-dependent exoDNAse (exonuclease V) alpha subunit